MKPLRTNDKIRNLHVIMLDQYPYKAIDRTNKQVKELKTWHHLPIYLCPNVANKSAMFVQPRKMYDQHFSIHPEWGFHTQVNMAKC